jgi:hypothetical protein
MEIVKQRGDACFPTSIFMLNDNKGWGKIKTLCKKRLNYKLKGGTHIPTLGEVHTLLEDLGMEPLIEPPKRHGSFASATGFHRALILVVSHFTDSEAHAVAWNGHEIYDPYSGIMTGRKLLKKFTHCDFIVVKIKTPMRQRFLNAFRHYFKFGIAE